MLQSGTLVAGPSPNTDQISAGYGAMPLLDAPLSLVLPLETVAAALKAANKL